MQKSILIIEEDKGLGGSLSAMLSDRGYGAVLVKDEDEARLFLSTETPCLILVGTLPPARVREVVKFLREQDRSIPAIILSTGHAGALRSRRRTEVEKADSDSAPGDPVVQRLTDVDALLRLVDRFCNSSRRAAVVN
jgi:DNA-binding NtrC family response regulator